MANDSLARGARSAVFPSSSSVPQKKWDDAFKDIKTPVTDLKKKTDGKYWKLR